MSASRPPHQVTVNVIRNFITGLSSRVNKVCDSEPERLRALSDRYPGLGTTQDAGEFSVIPMLTL